MRINSLRLNAKLLWLLALPAVVPACQVYTSSTVNQSNSPGNVDDNPCMEAQPSVQAVGSIVKSGTFLEAKAAIEAATMMNGLEHTVTFGRDAAGNITSSPLSNGGIKKGIVNSRWPGAFADLHNHPDNLPPSPGDFYGLVGIADNYPGYNTRIVFLADGTVYALVVIDQQAANNFVTQYPKVTGPGYSPKFPEPVITTFYDVRDGFIYKGYSHKDADTFGMAYILDKYNTGVIMLKQDELGVFKRLGVREELHEGEIAYLVSDCN